jgi:hypothetical protein
MTGFSPYEDAERAYHRAVERVEVLVAEWERLGKPETASGGSTGRALVPHPLIGAIQEAEALAHRLRQPVLRKHRGPEPSAVVQAKIGLSPAAKLRAR